MADAQPTVTSTADNGPTDTVGFATAAEGVGAQALRVSGGLLRAVGDVVNQPDVGRTLVVFAAGAGAAWLTRKG